jgi:Mitochondrial carrier protein
MSLIKDCFIANDFARNNPIPPYRGITDALKTIYREEGFLSLYRGVIINMVAGSIANSVFFYVYQDGKKRYDYDPKQPYSLKTILISLRAGLISMAVSAPLWTIKTRMVLYREQFHVSVRKLVL